MPKILSKKIEYKSDIFEICDLKLEFDNGVKVDYEVLFDKTLISVVIVPIDNEGNVYLVREYFAGIDKYQMTLPTGGFNYQHDKKKLTFKQAAQEELQEEAGFKAKKMVKLGEFTCFAGSQNRKIEVFLGTDLKLSKRQGDEPEELELIKVKIEAFEELIEKGELQDASSIAALFMARQYLAKKESK